MNLANKLTLLRLALVPVFMVFTITDNLWTRIFALLIFIAAGITDLYDGHIARKYNLETVFGKFMDPVADKFLISAAFISFVSLRELHVPPWMVVLIIGREFLITGLRSLAASKNVIIAADRLGKFKTTSQITSVIVILLILCADSVLVRYYQGSLSALLSRSDWTYGVGFILTWTPYWMVFVTTVLTLVSGISYLHKNRHVFAEDVGLKPSK